MAAQRAVDVLATNGVILDEVKVSIIEQRRPERIIAQLNEIYASRPAAVDPVLAEMQRRTIRKEI